MLTQGHALLLARRFSNARFRGRVSTLLVGIPCGSLIVNPMPPRTTE
jgi:hypothetical protein